MTTHSSKKQYLKQYECYQYENFMKGNYGVPKTLNLQFKGLCPHIHHELTHQIIDNVNPNSPQRMYICKWIIGMNNSCRLDFFQFGTQAIWRIQMNRHPLFLNIVNNEIYIVGGSQIFIIDFNTFSVINNVALGSDTIHAVEPALKINDSVTTTGVYLYSWNDKQGYRKRYFSVKQYDENRWWNSIATTILFKKANQQYNNSVLKVILPNILGVVIMSNCEQIYLINLTTMQIIEHTVQKLSSWHFTHPSKAILKYYLNKSSTGFDDSLLISVGEKGKQNVQVWVFHIKYHPQIANKINNLRQQSNSQGIGLTSMTSGDIVDWSLSVLQPFFCFSTQGQLIDYLLTQNGIIFYSNTQTKIPRSGFISYNSPLSLNPILSLEHNICSSYLKDNELYDKLQQLKKLSKQIQNNPQNKQKYNDRLQQLQQIQRIEQQLLTSLFAANRYSHSFLHMSIGMQQLTKIKPNLYTPKKLLLDWYKLYKIRRICVYKGDIIVLRQSAITTFLKIQDKQYWSQYQNGIQLISNIQSNNDGRDSTILNNFSRLSLDFSLPQSRYENNINIITAGKNIEQNWYKEINNISETPFTYQKPNKNNNTQIMMQNSNQQDQNEYFCQIYENYTQYFINRVNKLDVYNNVGQYLLRQQQISLKSLNLCSKLLINRVKDTILYYSKMLIYLYSRTSLHHSFSPSKHTHKADISYDNRHIEKPLINYLIFLNKLIAQPLHQVYAHGIDLVTMFVLQAVNKLYNNIDNNGDFQTKDVFVNIDKEMWNILHHMFIQLVVPSHTHHSESKHAQHIINPFIRLLLNNIKSQFEYIQQLIQPTFNPYFNLLDANNQTSEYIAECNEQCYFPLTATLLSIYCYLPVRDHVREQLLTTFVLSKFVTGTNSTNNKQNDQINVNNMLSKVIATRYHKQKIRSIYKRIIQTGKNRINNMMMNLVTSKNKSTTNYSVYNMSNGSGSNRDQEDVQQEYNSKNKVDNSHGIVQLTKMLSPQALQNNLLGLSLQQLDSIFKISIQGLINISINNGSIDVSNNRMLNINTNQQINGRKYTNQQLLTSWVFKYRVYVKLYRTTIDQIRSKNKQKNNGIFTTYDRNTKQKLQHIVKTCISSLQNIKHYYYSLYSNTKKIQRKDQTKQLFKEENVQNNFMNISDEEVIQKICCRMMGFDNCHDLYLYAKQDGQRQRILPTSSFLNLIYNLLLDPQTYPETVTGLNSISFYYMNKLLQQPQKNIHLLKQFGKFYSRRQLNQIIMQNGNLIKYYQNLPNNQYGQAIRAYFPYCDVMNLMNGSLVAERVSKLMSEKNIPSKSNMSNTSSNRRQMRKADSRINQGNQAIGEQQPGSIRNQNILPFRNMYLQAIGR